MRNERGNMLARLALGLGVGAIPFAGIAAERIIVQSTTSTRNSGLYDHLLPLFTAKTGIAVHVVAVGTGQAIKNAEQCNGDVLLVHSRADEEKFVAAGFGVKRHDLMYNDFVIAGPKADPASVRGSRDAVAALQAIAAASAGFVSRGDDSGTHKAELKLWKNAGFDPKPASGQWYFETGSDMGAALNVAAETNSYVLTDRATFASFNAKRELEILVEGDVALFNQYGVIEINTAKCPDIAARPARAFIDWLTSPEGQEAIAGYRVGGEQLFFPNADKATN
jgi:tungstate transport system substrate-binding protein